MSVFASGNIPAKGGGFKVPAANAGQYLRAPHLGQDAYDARPGEMHEFTTDILAASVLTMRATPVELVPAPGAGFVWRFRGGLLCLEYLGTAYTESTANLAVKYNNGSGAAASVAIEATGFADATAHKNINVLEIIDCLCVANQSLVLHNTGAGEWGGAGTGKLHFHGLYQLVQLGY